MSKFYVERIGMEVWLEQPGIAILRHGNMLIGFHETGQADRECLMTFVYETKEEVDEMHSLLGECSVAAPKVNDKFRIYNFFAKDPEGRSIEFQAFLHPVSMPWR